jgi:hypothetical protein
MRMEAFSIVLSANSENFAARIKPKLLNIHPAGLKFQA